MRPPALTSCLLLALAARAAAAPRCTVLWIPPPSFSAWSQLDALLKDHRGLRLTVGVSEDMLNPSALRALKPWIDDGRLEAALRLDGDPLLPLIAGQAEAPRPEDPAARLAVELERWKAAAGFTPAGFAPGAGAASRELLGTLGSMGLRWAATGAYSPDAAWSSYDGVAAVPLRAVRSDSSSVAVPDLTGGPVVVDESDGLVAEGSLLRWLRSSAVSACDWSTVSKALASRSLAPAAAGSWPAWTGDLEEWTSSASAQTAWSLYGQAARLLDQYQNSGTADLKQLDEATNELYAAQANRYYRAPPQGQAAAIAAEFHSHLANIYRDLGRTPPDSLLDVAVSSAAVSADLRVEQGQG
ncbi:MAG: hypothetical protein KGK30_03785, partial [Elusimicrobia bacterium]|nr:hypothetical protein [Elusimicrobiota bacterium]